MRHSYKGKKLSRTTNERKSLFRNLLRSMIEHGAIKTTKAKAIAVRSDLEKLITKAKKGTDANRRLVLSALADRRLVDQLMEMGKTQFANRNSGYTRIVKLGTRLGDGTETVLLSFVDEKVISEVIAPAKSEKKASVETNKPEKKVVAKKSAAKKSVTK